MVQRLCILFFLLNFFSSIFIFGIESRHLSDSDDPLRLTLEKAVTIALSAQRKMGSAINAVTTAGINLELAESEFDIKYAPRGDAGYVGGGEAGAGPTLGTGIEFTKRFRQGSRLLVYPTIMKAAHNFQSNLKATFTQPLLRGFGSEYTLSPIRAAEYANRTAIRSYYLAQTRLILQTIQSLYDVVRQEAMVGLEQESLERIRKYSTSTKMKEKIGLSESLDVYRAEIELKRAEDSLNQALERLQDAKDTVRETIALPMDQEIEVDVPIEYQIAVIPEENAIALALSKRIEIDQAEDQLEDQRRLQYMAKSNTWPELNLVLDYSSLSRDEEFTRIWTYRRESKWGVGVMTSSDIGRVRENAAYEQSIMSTADAQRNVEQVGDNITLEVKRALRTLARAQEKIATQEMQINNSLKEFHLARVKFEHGLANNFDLIQAEKNLRSAQTSLISATIEHKIGQFKLLAALGMLVDKPDICK